MHTTPTHIPSTPRSLASAIHAGDEHLVHTLILQGSDLNQEDSDTNMCPLLAAVNASHHRNYSSSSLGLVRLLIDHGARSQVMRQYGSVLHALAETQNGPFPSPTTMGDRWRDAAQAWGWSLPPSVQLWQMIIDGGCSPLVADKKGVTPFHTACAQGNWPVVRFLLQKRHIPKGSIDCTDQRSRTALHYAAMHGRGAVVVLLLSSGARASALCNQGYTPAELARESGHERVSQQLDVHFFRACPLMSVPSEVLHNILAYLSPHDLCAVACTCSVLREASSDEHLWRPFCGTSCGTSTSEEAKTRYLVWVRNWLKLYARRPPSVVQRRNSSQPDYDQLWKVSLCGQVHTGKTALHTRLIHDYFPPYPSTLAIEFGHKIYTLEDGTRIKLQVWDTCGMERFRIMNRTYYRGTRGVVLVYDICERETLPALKQWVEDALAHADNNLTFVLVGTKSDLAPTSRQVTPEEGQAMAKELGADLWTELSSRTDGGDVEKLFKRLAQLIHESPIEQGIRNGWWIPDEALIRRLTARPAVVAQPTASCVLQ